MNKLPIALAGLLASPLPVLAVPANATLNLVEEDGFNEIELSIDPPILPGDSDTTSLDGAVEVLMEIDPDSGQVSEITVTGGSVTGSPVELSRSSFLGSYDFSSTELGAEVTTLSPPGVVDPVSGNFDAAEHGFLINSGTLGGNASVPLLGVNEAVDFDFATEPIEGTGTGTGTVSLEETTRDPDSVTYDVTVLLPVELTEVVMAAGLEIEVTAEGTIKAVGTTIVPLGPEDAYAAWAEENNLAGAAFEGDENNDGVPNGLQWALGLDAAISPFPFLLQPMGEVGATVVFSITLPESGSAADIMVTGSADPPSIPFAPLPSSAVGSGNPIPAGSSGTVTIELPKNGQGFVQLAVTAPGP